VPLEQKTRQLTREPCDLRHIRGSIRKSRPLVSLCACPVAGRCRQACSILLGHPRPAVHILGGSWAGGSGGCTVQARIALLHDLYDSHYRELVRVAALLTGDTVAVEQIVECAFADTYRAAAWLGPDKKLAYLRRRVVIRARSRPRPGTGTNSRVVAPSINVNADAHAMTAAIAALATMPNRHREVIVLRYYANMTDAEIAASLATSVRAVRRHLDEGLAVFGAALPAAGR
jgi:RNA polymerase sigma factor (sigma-70 family)